MTSKQAAKKIGDRAPEATFQERQDGDLKQVSSSELFKGKKVIIFALPGAFTPTCSSTHLPRYEELADVFTKQAGIDEIICLSVNDAFVMEAWGKNQHADHVRLLADGNGTFAEGMGLLVDKSDLGFGKRSWRYSMLVNDGVIEQLFIEPDQAGDPFEVSDADTMLKAIAPNATLPAEVTIFTKPGCSFCAEAKALLTEKNMRFEEVELGGNLSYKTLRNVSGKNTAPQVFIDQKPIGGLTELKAFMANT